MDKAAQKKIKQELREKAKQDFVASLPMPVELFDELFDLLDERLEAQGCDHTLTITSAFLEEKGLSPKDTLEWMKEYGGYCDCEVLANVEDPFLRFQLL